MERNCIICNGVGKYKCPMCLVFYCSVVCCKRHRETSCDVLVKGEEAVGCSSSKITAKYPSADTISIEKLMLLKGNSKLADILCNPHLKDLLISINNAENPERIMEMAMQEPLFVEFADICLKIVEPNN